jgi:hypothetical protein
MSRWLVNLMRCKRYQTLLLNELESILNGADPSLARSRKLSAAWMADERSDGGEGAPYWRPDGKSLINSQWADPSQGGFAAFDAQLMWMNDARRTSEVLSRPPGSQILDWIGLPLPA